MRIRNTLQKPGPSIIRMLVVFLMVLYIIGTAQQDLLHAFSHSHHASISHSEEQEKDPCHRSIYHHDMEQGCDHDSHLNVSDKCQMCDHAFHGDQTFLSHVDFVTLELSTEHFDCYKQSLDAYWAVISSSRAPPAMI
jgi:hypothetical protein